MTPYQEIRKMRTYKKVLDGKITVPELIKQKLRQLEYKKDIASHVIKCNKSTIAKAQLDIQKAKAHNSELKKERTTVKNTINTFKKGLKQELERQSFLGDDIKTTMFYDINNNIILGTHKIKMKKWHIDDIYMHCGNTYKVIEVKIEELVSGKVQAVFVKRAKL